MLIRDYNKTAFTYADMVPTKASEWGNKGDLKVSKCGIVAGLV